MAKRVEEFTRSFVGTYGCMPSAVEICIALKIDTFTAWQYLNIHKGVKMQMVNGFPRRNRVDFYTPSETAIRASILAVEESGCHPLLTDAVELLHEAQSKVADFVELGTPSEQQEQPSAK